MAKYKGGKRQLRIKPTKCRSCVRIGVWPGQRCYDCRRRGVR